MEGRKEGGREDEEEGWIVPAGTKAVQGPVNGGMVVAGREGRREGGREKLSVHAKREMGKKEEGAYICVFRYGLLRKGKEGEEGGREERGMWDLEHDVKQAFSLDLSFFVFPGLVWFLKKG